MIDIGSIQKLKITKLTSIGAYLSIDDKDKVLLPKKQLRPTAKVGDEVEVFVYNDSENRPIATTRKPLLTVGDIATLKVVDKTKIGCFLDMGLERDLLLPFSEQMGDVDVGDRVKVLMYVDKSHRLCATMYTYKDFVDKDGNIQKKTVLDKEKVKTSQYELAALKVYKKIKEKYKSHLLYTDKMATPDMIKNDFGMSKAEFKKAIGKLLKDQKIKINDNGIFAY